jgi:AraC-like DNA-binding protein
VIDAVDLHLDSVRLWSMRGRPAECHRTVDPETYNVCLVQHGEVVYAGEQPEQAYGPGDIVVHDSSRPYGLRTDAVTCVGVEIPKAMVPIPRDLAGRVVGRRIPGQEGMGALLATFLTQLATDTGRYRPSDAPRLAVVAADLVSALFSHVLDEDAGERSPEAHRRTLTLRIKAFIRRRLGDPALTREAIAAAHHISTSHLHRLFQDDGTGVMAWIRQQRIEHARRDLADPEWHAVPIHQIAARWGFTHHADFTRAFRNTYGLPPSEYRRQAQRRQFTPEHCSVAPSLLRH